MRAESSADNLGGAAILNALAPGVALTPGMAATIPELQLAGYLYIK